MVHWNDKERGIPLTDGPCNPYGLNLSCEACKHSVLMPWADVLKRWPLGAYSRDMAASLKCSQCGARQACIMVSAHTPAGS